MSNDRVVVYVSVAGANGSFEPVKQSHRILKLSYQDNETKADKLTLAVDNHDLYHLDSPIWRKGNLVRVGWGYGGLLAPPRECVIDKVSGGLVIKIEANGKEMTVNKVLKTGYWEDKKGSDVVKEIADGMGFTADQQFIQDTKIVHPHITRRSLTDAQFLMSLAKAEGFDWYIDYDGFHFHERILNQKPQATLRYVLPGPNHAGADIIDFNVDKGIDATKPASIKMYGRDPLTKEEIYYLADNASVKRHALAPSAGLYSPDDASTEKLAERIGTEFVMRHTARTEEELKRVADGLYKRIQLQAITLKVTARGIPALVAKSTIAIEGLGPTISGTYYVKSINHSVIPSPYKMALELTRDGQSMEVAPDEEPLEGQGDGVETKGTVNTQEPVDPEELELVTGEDGVEYTEPGRQIKTEL